MLKTPITLVPMPKEEFGWAYHAGPDDVDYRKAFVSFSDGTRRVYLFPEDITAVNFAHTVAMVERSFSAQRKRIVGVEIL